MVNHVCPGKLTALKGSTFYWKSANYGKQQINSNKKAPFKLDGAFLFNKE